MTDQMVWAGCSANGSLIGGKRDQEKKLVEVYPELNPIANGNFFFCHRNRWDDPLISSFLK